MPLEISPIRQPPPGFKNPTNVDNFHNSRARLAGLASLAAKSKSHAAARKKNRFAKTPLPSLPPYLHNMSANEPTSSVVSQNTAYAQPPPLS
jgi:hypothetical protein